MNRREALKQTATIMGYAISASAGAGFLNGCRPGGKPDWIPVFLSPEEIKIAAEISEIILPATGMPGAIALHVPEFIDLMLKDCYTGPDQENFRDGLNLFRETVISEHKKPFEKCDEQLKVNIISEEEERAYTNLNKTGHKSFYLVLKELTLLGYFSSEYVMTNLLDYHPVATRYEGCIPFGEGDRLYVDNNV